MGCASSVALERRRRQRDAGTVPSSARRRSLSERRGDDSDDVTSRRANYRTDSSNYRTTACAAEGGDDAADDAGSVAQIAIAHGSATAMNWSPPTLPPAFPEFSEQDETAGTDPGRGGIDDAEDDCDEDGGWYSASAVGAKLRPPVSHEALSRGLRSATSHPFHGGSHSQHHQQHAQQLSSWSHSHTQDRSDGVAAYAPASSASTLIHFGASTSLAGPPPPGFHSSRPSATAAGGASTPYPGSSAGSLPPPARMLLLPPLPSPLAVSLTHPPTPAMVTASSAPTIGVSQGLAASGAGSAPPGGAPRGLLEVRPSVLAVAQHLHRLARLRESREHCAAVHVGGGALPCDDVAAFADLTSDDGSGDDYDCYSPTYDAVEVVPPAGAA